MAGFAGAEADKLFETHGLNQFDKFEARRRKCNDSSWSLCRIGADNMISTDAQQQAEQGMSQDNYDNNY